MGCGQSRELEDNDDHVVAPPAEAGGKGDTTRARRLSYAVEARLPQGPAHAQVLVSCSGSSGSGGSGSAKHGCANSPHADLASVSPTRSRRLSHIVTPQHLAAASDLAAAHHAAEHKQQPHEHDDPQPQAPTRQQQQQQLGLTDSYEGGGGTATSSSAASPRPQRTPGASPRQQQPEQQPPAAASSPQRRPAAQHGGMRVAVACMSRVGREPGSKKTNQDNCFAFEKFISDDQCLFGAMDGHGPNGHHVSAFVKRQLPPLLLGPLGSATGPTGVQAALRQAFLEVDGQLGSAIDCEFSGCTCAVAHIKGRTLTTAWVGDSRMVLGRQRGRWRGWEAVDLSSDHKPTDAEERRRILDSQGRVERLVDELGQPMGPYRVWLQHAWLPGLAMSRALGDELAHTVGVSSEPQHRQLELTPADRLLVLASDGVWEFISSKEAVELAGACDTPEEACRALVDEACQRWLVEEEGVVDDITAIVVWLLHDGE